MRPYGREQSSDESNCDSSCIQTKIDQVKVVSMIVAQTRRLLLQTMSGDDAEGMYLLNANPEVIRYTGDPPFADIEEARSFATAYAHYTDYGFGRWSLYLKDSQRYLGFCGLKYHPEDGEVDLGFRLRREEWGEGYATEASWCALGIGFMKYGLDSVIGVAQVDNHASLRVLHKLGMTYESTFTDKKGTWKKSRLTREDYLATVGPM